MCDLELHVTFPKSSHIYQYYYNYLIKVYIACMHAYTINVHVDTGGLTIILAIVLVYSHAVFLRAPMHAADFAVKF